MNETILKYQRLLSCAMTAADICWMYYHHKGGPEYDRRAQMEYDLHFNNARRFRIYLAAIS